MKISKKQLKETIRGIVIEESSKLQEEGFDDPKTYGFPVGEITDESVLDDIEKIVSSAKGNTRLVRPKKEGGNALVETDNYQTARSLFYTLDNEDFPVAITFGGIYTEDKAYVGATEESKQLTEENNLQTQVDMITSEMFKDYCESKEWELKKHPNGKRQAIFDNDNNIVAEHNQFDVVWAVSSVASDLGKAKKEMLDGATAKRAENNTKVTEEDRTLPEPELTEKMARTLVAKYFKQRGTDYKGGANPGLTINLTEPDDVIKFVNENMDEMINKDEAPVIEDSRFREKGKAITFDGNDQFGIEKITTRPMKSRSGIRTEIAFTFFSDFQLDMVRSGEWYYDDE